jgi:hypothetical protein
MPDTILEGGHPRIISAKFGWNWLSSFRREDFFNFHAPFFLFLAWRPSWLEVGITGHNFGRGPSKDHSTKVLLQLAQWFLRRFLCEFPLRSYVKLNWAVGAILVEGPNRRTHFGREPSNDYFINILFLLSKWFQTRTFLREFPIGSYVKLSSAVVAILVGVLKCRTQFWKRTIVRLASLKQD